MVIWLLLYGPWNQSSADLFWQKPTDGPHLARIMNTRVRTEREEKGKQVIYLYRSFSVSPLKEPSFSRGSLPGNYAGYFKCIISWVCHEASQSLSLPRLRVRRLRPVAGRCTAAGARPESLAAGRGLPAPVFAGGSAGSGSDRPEEEKGKLLGLGG